jgi:hypothetical protein
MNRLCLLLHLLLDIVCHVVCYFSTFVCNLLTFRSSGGGISQC